MGAQVIELAKWRAFKDELAKIAKADGLAKVSGFIKTAKRPRLLPKAKPIGQRGGFTRTRSLPAPTPLGQRTGPAPKRDLPAPAASRGQVQPPPMTPGLLAKQRAARAKKPMPEATPLGQRQSGDRFLPKGRALGARDVATPVQAQRVLPTPAAPGGVRLPTATPLGARQSGARFLPTRPAPTVRTVAPPAAPPTRLRPAAAPPPPPRRLRPAA